MKCVTIIERWGVAELAKDLGIPTKNVRRWLDFDSIPAEWFNALAQVARARGFHDITLEVLAAGAEARRLARRQSPTAGNLRQAVAAVSRNPQHAIPEGGR